MHEINCDYQCGMHERLGNIEEFLVYIAAEQLLQKRKEKKSWSLLATVESHHRVLAQGAHEAACRMLRKATARLKEEKTAHRSATLTLNANQSINDNTKQSPIVNLRKSSITAQTQAKPSQTKQQTKQKSARATPARGERGGAKQTPLSCRCPNSAGLQHLFFSRRLLLAARATRTR